MIVKDSHCIRCFDLMTKSQKYIHLVFSDITTYSCPSESTSTTLRDILRYSVLFWGDNITHLKEILKMLLQRSV